MSIIVKLDVKTASGIVATLEFHNDGSEDAFVETAKACLDGQLTGRQFQLSCGERKIPYVGKLVKRRELGPEDFSRLAPGASLSTSVGLTDAYELSSEAQSYELKYRAVHAHPDSDDLVILESPVVSFAFP